MPQSMRCSLVTEHVGLWCRHWNHRHSPQHPPPCDMELGASNMPDVVAELEKIGKWIKAQQPRSSESARSESAAVDA